MAKDITIGNVNFIDVEKLKIKEKDKDTYAEFIEMSPEDQAKIISDNIKSGVTILGQAGAVTPAKAEETKTVTPNFASGNVVVTPTSGKVMTQVTVNKDSNLIANNIKKDVTVHGITGSSFIAIELTQAQYDALSVYDNNTYYLIVEDE